VKKTPDRRGPEQSKVKLLICNNRGYNCEYSNKFECQIRSSQLFTVAENLSRHNIENGARFIFQLS
jgi:hypothetical protein